FIERPQRLEDGVRPLRRPALVDIAPKLSLDVGAVHWTADEPGHVVDLADDALSVGEDGGDTYRHRGRTGACAESVIFGDGDFAHKGEDMWIAKLSRFVVIVIDFAVEHGPRRYVGQAVIRRVSGIRRPFLEVAPGLLVTPAGGSYFDRRDATEIA